MLPSREVNFWFDDFDLANLDQIQLRPSGDTLLIRNLRTEAQRELARAADGPREERPENYIIRHLVAYPEVDYDSQADQLYKWCGQIVDRLKAYLAGDDEVEAVALEHGKRLADFIFQQMRSHFRQTPVEYTAKRVRAFRMLKPQQVLSPLSRDTAEQIASAAWTGPGSAIRSSKSIEAPVGTEFGGPFPAWQVQFADPDSTRLYVDASTGAVLAARSDTWRFFDFVWGLHIMDWTQRDRINSWWLLLFGIGGTVIAGSGFVLLANRLPKLHRRRTPK